MTTRKYNTSIIFNTNNKYYNYFFANYLNCKYPKVTCMNPDLLLEFKAIGFTSNGIHITYNGYSQVYNGKNYNSIFFSNFINSCKNRFILLPILYFEIYNILIYDTKLKQVELFNPGGETAIHYYKELADEFESSNPYAYNESSYADYIELTKNLFKNIDNKIKFFTPVSFFPKDKNFLRYQIVDCDNISFHKAHLLLRGMFSNFFINSLNFSVAWSFYYIEKRLKNPNKSRNVLVRELLSLFKQDVKSIKSSGSNSGKVNIKLPICEIIKDYASFLQNLDKNVSFFRRLQVNFKMHKGEFVKYTKIILAGFLLLFGLQELGKRQRQRNLN